MEYLQFRRLLRREISTIFRLPQNGWRSENINDCNELREEKRINDNFNTDGTVKELKAILMVYWIEHMKAISYFK